MVHAVHGHHQHGRHGLLKQSHSCICMSALYMCMLRDFTTTIISKFEAEDYRYIHTCHISYIKIAKVSGILHFMAMVV